MDNLTALTAKQQIFVEAYLGQAKGNATEAARIAGYAVPRQEGARLLANAVIAAAVEERLSLVKGAMSADEVIERLSDQARLDPLRFALIDPETGLAKIDLAAVKAAGMGHLVKGIKFDRFGNQIVEWHDAQAATVHLGRYHKLFTDRVEQGDGTLRVVVEFEDKPPADSAAVESAAEGVE